MKILILFLFISTIITTETIENSIKLTKKPITSIKERNLNQRNLNLVKQLMKSGPHNKRAVRNYKNFIEVLQNPSDKRRFLTIMKNQQGKKNFNSRNRRKLTLMGFSFLDEHLPFLQNNMVETLINSAILYFGGKFVTKKLQERELTKLKAEVNKKKGDLAMIGAQKERDLRYVQQSMVDLEDHLQDLEETMNSNLDDLDHWVDGTVTNLGLI